MRGVGAKTYETYKSKYGKEPTSYALYAAEGTRVIIDAIKRAAPAIEKAKDATEKREARGRPSRPPRTTKASTASGASTRTATSTTTPCPASRREGGRPVGCKFQFETILE
jgi:ABC-type branched-subunit amino acid transport system substrate-binding protein